MPIRKRTNSSPGLPRGEPLTSPVLIPRSSTVSGGFNERRTGSKKSPTPTQHASSSRVAKKAEQNSTPKMSVDHSPASSLGTVQSPKEEASPIPKKEAAACSSKGTVTPLTAALQAMNDKAHASGMNSGFTQQALVGFSGASISKGLAQPSTGRFRRALSNIEPFVTKDSSPILTALARHSNVAAGVHITDLSEPGLEDKQMIRVHSSPAILAMGLPMKGGSLLTTPAFQIGAGAAAPIYRRQSSSGSNSVKVRSPPPSPTGLPTIPGSPTKTSQSKESATDLDKEMKPLKGLFTIGSPSPSDTVKSGLFGSPRRSLNKTQSNEATPAVISQGIDGFQSHNSWSYKFDKTKLIICLKVDFSFARGTSIHQAGRYF